MAIQTASPESEQSDREEIMHILRAAIERINARTENLEANESADDQDLVRWYRTLGYLTGQYRKLTKDTDIDEMESELELLKTATEVSRNG